MSSLAINLITRNRPARFLETTERALDGCVRDDTRLMVSVDEDDVPSVQALRHLPKDPRIVPRVRPREDGLGEKYNRVLELDATLYTHMSDYAPCVTRGWDQKMLDAASRWPDGIGVVFSNYVNASFAGIYGVTRSLTEHLGYFFPPYFPYWFVDHWIDDIGRMIGRVAHADVTIDTPGGKPGTQNLRDLPFWTRVFDAGAPVRRREALDVIDHLESPSWEREVLRRNFYLTEYRSRFISDMARETAQDLPPDAPSAEPRYLRLKAQAECLMVEWSALAAEDLS